MTVMRRNPVPGSLFPIGGAAALALLLAAGPGAAQGTETGNVSRWGSEPPTSSWRMHTAPPTGCRSWWSGGPVVLEFFRSGGW